PSSGIYITDYLPSGAEVKDLNITLYNSSLGDWVDLVNGSDYYISLDNPGQTVLPDGIYVDVHYYNLSYVFTNWDGNLYDNDTIRIEYNITVLGGGEWVLPSIIAGFDPEYQKHIRTEMYASASVPSFDVILEMLSDTVKPGGVVKALLRILNVGGPKAKVDVFVTYSAKTLAGEMLSERSETLAVVEEKEKSLELKLPEDIPTGTYIFESFVSYTGREALSTGTFWVKDDSQAGLLEGYGLYIFLVVIIIVLTLMFRRATSRKGTTRPGLLSLIFLALALLLPLGILVSHAAGQEITGSLEMVHGNLEPGDDAKALLKMRNSNFTGYRTDVVITYSLNDPAGQLIKAESGTFPISDSRDLLFKLTLPKDAAPGSYSFETEMEYPGDS
ncbi:MAG: hypothetical protein KAT35_01025, partial [Candidatus Aenigmarchaeota archaeon]|nr:hypothetical protein [Candidatus Aenigmarchaeota archaeon]